MPANTGVAPICNAKAEPPVFTPAAPPLPKFSTPNVNNPKSIVQAIMQLQQALTALTTPPAPNNTTPGSPIGGIAGPGGGVGGGGGGKPKQPPDDQWRERSRVTQNVKVVNPDDDSQFVVVKEIVQIIFERPISGETITLTRDAG